MKGKKTGKYLDKSFIVNTVIVIAAVFGIFAVGIFGGLRQMTTDANFASGISVNGIDLSKKTYEQGKRMVSDETRSELSGISVSLLYNGIRTTLDAQELGVSSDPETVVDQAYNMNKKARDSVEQRYNKTVGSRGKNYKTTLLFDKNTLYDTIRKYTEERDVQPVNATASFDPVTCRFSFTAEQSGSQIDADALAKEILTNLKAGDYLDVEVKSVVVSPEETESDLEKNTEMIGRCETTASNNKNRDTNIRLMCEAVDGLEVKPGQTLSINDLMGERTEAKGFKAAPAIMDGSMLIDDIGGGICQLAGTLYNAALKANMEIVERVHHSWPSNYLPIGLDATLNWDNKDLKIKNTSAHSIYISAKFANHIVSVKLYGEPLPEGMSIRLENDIMEVIPSSGTEIRYTNELPNGVRQTASRPRKGYDVEVYRVYMRDGQAVGKTLVSHDKYPAIKGIVLVGKNTAEK